MNTDAEIETLLVAVFDPFHTCETSWESAPAPDRHGNVTVTGHCVCGRITSVTHDRII